jgi:hypothetical protein
MRAVTETEHQALVDLGQLLCERDVDARRRGPARRVRQLARTLAVDLGGPDLPMAQRMLVQRSAFLGVLCSHFECSLARGKMAFPLSDYLAMCSTLRRCLATLGTKRVPRDVTPSSLAEVLAEAAQAAP